MIKSADYRSQPPVGDPFAIGWRDVPFQRPDGTTDFRREPLTLDDALHPREGDTIVQSTLHDRDWGYLRDVLKCRTASDPHALVLADCKVLWEDGVHHSPDLAVIFDVADPSRTVSHFDVAAEGVRPRLIIEVVSVTTRENDIEKKFEAYPRYRVPMYVIVDREEEDGSPRLLGYELKRRRYVPMPLDDQGRLWLEPVGIALGVRDNRVVAYDGATGEEIGDYTAITEALEAEIARADEEKRRADEEKRRADEEKRRADEEKRRADASEERIRQLEALLRARTGANGNGGPKAP